MVRHDPLEVRAEPAQRVLDPILAPDQLVTAVEHAHHVAHAGIGSSSEPK
jgi:hypothetical protein